MPMTEERLFEFDLNGFIVFREVLGNAELATLNAALIRCAPADPQHFGFLDADPSFMDLMALPTTLDVLRVMLGDWFRLDHAYAITMSPGTAGAEYLHGGPRTDQHEHQYEWRNGRMYNGLVVVSYALTDMPAGQGGFVCVPGSHKSNLLVRVAQQSPLVVQPELRAGDVLFFTEALIHGTRSWTASHQRRSLLYKYSPGYSAWAVAERLAPLAELARTEMQRALLRPPCVGGRTPLPFEAG